MNLQKDLNKLGKSLSGDDKQAFAVLIAELKEKYTSESDLETIDAFVRNEAGKLIAETDKLINEVSVRQQLVEISDMVSLSYIAKNYFNKTRQWLYQRINGSTVNNKPARFTDKELDTLNFALQDISKKIGSISVSA